MRFFKCENGNVYMCSDRACVFCDHCIDIIYDYTNGPYLLLCELPEHDTHNGAGCEHFIEGVIRQIKTDFPNASSEDKKLF